MTNDSEGTRPSCDDHPALVDPWEFARSHRVGVVVSLLVQTIGPAYRSPGTAMAISPDRSFAGAITSGCVEADLILQADRIRADGSIGHLRYGAGSPYFDIRLPCGGGIEILQFELRDPDVLDDLATARRERRACSLLVSPEGRLTLDAYRPTGPFASGFAVGFVPPVSFAVFGAGPEAVAFSSTTVAFLISGRLFARRLDGPVARVTMR